MWGGGEEVTLNVTLVKRVNMGCRGGGDENYGHCTLIYNGLEMRVVKFDFRGIIASSGYHQY